MNRLRSRVYPFTFLRSLLIFMAVHEEISWINFMFHICFLKQKNIILLNSIGTN